MSVDTHTRLLCRVAEALTEVFPALRKASLDEIQLVIRELDKRGVVVEISKRKQ